MSHTSRRMNWVAVSGLTLAALLFSSRAAPGLAVQSKQDLERSTPLQIVALGDSDATGHGDPTRRGWVGRYAQLLRQRLGLRVTVTNLARDGKTSSMLLSEIRSDPTTRAAVRQADIVLFGIGGADLNPGDARWDAGKCKGKPCYAADLQAFGRNFDATVAVARKLRRSQNTVLRAITLANAAPGALDVIPPFGTIEIGRYQAESLLRSICGSMGRRGGRCIDVLHAFNGQSGTEDAYAKGLMNKRECCYPSARGQQLMAELLFKTGLKPLR
jgi:lysophospholipase L1-like esterase